MNLSCWPRCNGTERFSLHLHLQTSKTKPTYITSGQKVKEKTLSKKERLWCSTDNIWIFKVYPEQCLVAVWVENVLTEYGTLQAYKLILVFELLPPLGWMFDAIFSYNEATMRVKVDFYLGCIPYKNCTFFHFVNEINWNLSYIFEF